MWTNSEGSGETAWTRDKCFFILTWRTLIDQTGWMPRLINLCWAHKPFFFSFFFGLAPAHFVELRLNYTKDPLTQTRCDNGFDNAINDFWSSPLSTSIHYVCERVRLDWALVGRLCDTNHNFMSYLSIHYVCEQRRLWRDCVVKGQMLLYTDREDSDWSVGLDTWFLVGPFVYFHTLCVRTAKALARLRGHAGSPERSLVAYVISTIISWAGS